MNEELLLQSIKNDLAIQLPDKISFEELENQLAEYFNQLIQTNFQQLVFLLYRIDVSEAKLKNLLAVNPNTDAGKLIAALVIERQVQKIKSKQDFKSSSNIPEDEKW